MAVGLSTTYWELALARALNGVGLAVVLPSIQSFVADTHSAEQRGSGFGWLQFTNYSGRVFEIERGGSSILVLVRLWKRLRVRMFHGAGM